MANRIHGFPDEVDERPDRGGVQRAARKAPNTAPAQGRWTACESRASRAEWHAPTHPEDRRMKTVAEILKAKGDSTVYAIAPSATVFEALQRMAEKNIGALLVMEGERIVGVVTERDYARKVILMSRSSKETPLRDVMTSAVIYVRPSQTSDECMALMTESRVRHLPVIDGGRLVGLISIGDVVKSVISEQGFIIDQLLHYISGDRG
jgi:CBS domain-containing protein